MHSEEERKREASKQAAATIATYHYYISVCS